jgi:D-sedoheptulose 7-phosphate isomerase
MSDSSTNRQREFAGQYLDELKRCADAISREHVAEIIGYLEEAYREGRQVFIIGNGGSAATASHMACDLGNWILPEEGRETGQRLRVMSLTDNVPWITALGNDRGYEHVFSEQLRSLARPQDLVIAISGSGNSPNVLEGIRAAKALGAKVVALLGFDGGKAKEMVDAYVHVESNHYGHVEDLHLVLNHLVSLYLKKELAAEAGR